MVLPGEVRALFEAKLKENPTDFNQADLERVKNDKYIERIIHHQDDNAENSCQMLWDILTWRKNINAAEINENTLRMDYIRSGAIFPHGRDIDGHVLLIFKSKQHIKGQKDLEELKKCVVYWFDRIEREEDGKPITLFFDMDGCGLSNMDLEFIKFFILLLTAYYPYFLHYIVIFQMPWILNAAFKVVKSLLPAKAVERLKFTTRDNLKDLVSPDQALVCWGGLSEYVFEFIAESKHSSESFQKKVTFAEQGDQHSLGEMLKLNPNDTITFKIENDEISGSFVITNMDESIISFKIRTTSPEKFRVRPSSGILTSAASQTIVIVVQPGFQMKTVSKDRFLVMAVQIPKADLTQKELADVWQKSSGSKVDEYRLRCQFPEQEVAKNGTPEPHATDKSTELHTSLAVVQKNYEALNKSIKHIKVLQMLTFFLTFSIALFAFFMYQKTFYEDYFATRM